MDFSTIPASILAATSSQGDGRPITVQQVDYGTPYPAPQLIQAAGDLFVLENTKSMVGQQWGQGPVVTQQDVDNAFLKLNGDIGNAAVVQQAVANFEAWNPPQDSTGLDLPGRAAQAAVAGWSSVDFAAYLAAMLQGWAQADTHNGTSVPHPELTALYGRVLAAGGGAPKPAPLPGQQGGGLLQLPHGLVLTKTGGTTSKPLSTPAKVAVVAGGAGALAVGAAAIVAWAKGETLGFVLKKAWRKVID